MKNTLRNARLLYEAILTFSKIDHENKFSFTSGHLGAVSINDSVLRKIIFDAGCIYSAKRILYFVYEFCKFLLLVIIPIKSIGILLRTLLRLACNAKPQLMSHELAIISLGDSSADRDAYFAPLLAAHQGAYHYFKIVGGRSFLNKSYVYIESLLTPLDFAKFTLSALISPIVNSLYLVRGAWGIDDAKLRMTYLILGLKEINQAVVLQNELLSQSIESLLSNQAYAFNKILYPMEGRSWEQSAVKLCNLRTITSIGYVHCMLTPRHFSLIGAGFYQEIELPSLILTPSEMIFNLIKKSFGNVLVKHAFFLRGTGAKSAKNIAISPNKLLFALTGDEEQSKKIINLIANSTLHKKYDVIIRLNKNTSTYSALCAYTKSLGLSLYSDIDSNQSLPKVCFFRSSSVALDYLQYNCIPVYMQFDDEVSGNVFELDNRVKSQTVSIDPNFEFQIELILQRNYFSHQFSNGEAISNYYLNQCYSTEDLIQLIR